MILKDDSGLRGENVTYSNGFLCAPNALVTRTQKGDTLSPDLVSLGAINSQRRLSLLKWTSYLARRPFSVLTFQG